MKWMNPESAPFLISGFPFYAQDRVFRRMPLAGEGVLPQAVYELANETSGGQIRFHGKLKKLSIRVSLATKPGYFDNVMAPHLALTNKYGFDLYLSRDGKDYTFYGVSKKYTWDTRHYTYSFLEFPQEEEFDFLLNFPLYGGVDRVEIGFDDEAEITAPHYQFRDSKKIAIYGSSIQQGGCAGRPGLSAGNLISRWLDKEVYNLGFNSSGKAEAEVARVVADIKDLSLLIISVEGNCPDEVWLDEKVREFIRIFREKNPAVPVVILPFMLSGQEMLHSTLGAQRMRFRAVQEKLVADLKAAGDDKLFLFIQDVKEENFENHSVWHECTVDGLHYNDLGFLWTTKELCRFLKREQLV